MLISDWLLRIRRRSLARSARRRRAVRPKWAAEILETRAAPNQSLSLLFGGSALLAMPGFFSPAGDQSTGATPEDDRSSRRTAPPLTPRGLPEWHSEEFVLPRLSHGEQDGAGPVGQLTSTAALHRVFSEPDRIAASLDRLAPDLLDDLLAPRLSHADVAEVPPAAVASNQTSSAAARRSSASTAQSASDAASTLTHSPAARAFGEIQPLHLSQPLATEDTSFSTSTSEFSTSTLDSSGSGSGGGSSGGSGGWSGGSSGGSGGGSSGGSGGSSGGSGGTTVWIEATDPVATEGDTDEGELTFNRSGDTSADLTVTYSVSGTATNGDDYQQLPGTVTIAAGETSAAIVVDAATDSTEEGPETATLTLEPGSYTIGSPETATVTIYDELDGSGGSGGSGDGSGDGGGGSSGGSSGGTGGGSSGGSGGSSGGSGGGTDRTTVWIETIEDPAVEGEPETQGRFLISRDRNVDDMTIYYTVSGTATPETDYGSLGTSVIIYAGAYEASLAVSAYEDDTADPGETVVVTLTDDTAYTLGSPNSATVNIEDVPPEPEPVVDLQIYNGQDGALVQQEETVGAFTVTNLNDTDGDGQFDYSDDNGVPGEVDLMKLVLNQPQPYTGGNVTLTYSSTVALWEDSEKTVAVPSAGSSGGLLTAEFDLSNGAKTLWAEIISGSSTVRDVSITMSYKGSSDVVKATGVWATMTGIEHDTKDADVLLNEPVWSDMTQPSRGQIEYYGGTGLRPVSDVFGVRNLIVMRFRVGPDGIENEPDVKFDVTRQSAYRIWTVGANGQILLYTSEAFPLITDYANDDAGQIDPVNGNGHMFSVDGPGTASDTPEQGEELLVYRANFREFVRVTFGEDAPSGEGVSGSRASRFYDWHLRHRLENQGGVWARTTGDVTETNENDIGESHIDLGTGP